MIRSFFGAVIVLATFTAQAQQERQDRKDCTLEKDRIFIDWENALNKQYAGRATVERFSQRKLRQFYCENVVARDRLAVDGYVTSKGGFESANDEEKYVVFTLKMGDLLYQDKLYIHIGPRQKLLSSAQNRQ